MAARGTYFLVVGEVEAVFPDEILLFRVQRLGRRWFDDLVQLIPNAGVRFEVAVGEPAAHAAGQRVVLPLHQVVQRDLIVVEDGVIRLRQHGHHVVAALLVVDDRVLEQMQTIMS